MRKVDKVYIELKSRLTEQYWKQGERITSERDLATLLNVSRVTIKAALNKLIDEGLLEYIDGKKGTFVTVRNSTPHNGNTICVAIDNKTPAFSSFLLEGIHDTLLNKGFQTIYFNTLFNKENIEEQINYFILNNISGFILAPLIGKDSLENNNKIINLLIENNIPLVQVDRYATDSYGSYVGTNNLKAFYNLTKEVLKRGYSSILTIDGFKTTSTEERKSGILKALKEEGIVYKEISLDEISYIKKNKISLSEDQLQLINESDAIIGLNQNLTRAIKTFSPNKYMASISASKDECENNLSIIQPMYEIGKESGRLIIEQIDNKEAVQKQILIEGCCWEEE